MVIDYDLFLMSFACLLAMAGLAYVLITVWLKHQQALIHAYSVAGLFVFLGFMFLLFDFVSFDLEGYDYFAKWSRNAFLIGAIVFFCVFLYHKLMTNQRIVSLLTTSDDESVFFQSNVLSIITSVEDRVVLVNDVDVFYAVFDSHSENIQNTTYVQ